MVMLLWSSKYAMAKIEFLSLIGQVNTFGVPFILLLIVQGIISSTAGEEEKKYIQQNNLVERKMEWNRINNRE